MAEKFTAAFKGCPTGAVYPVTYAPGDVCPPELVEAAKAAGAIAAKAGKGKGGKAADDQKQEGGADQKQEGGADNNAGQPDLLGGEAGGNA